MLLIIVASDAFLQGITRPVNNRQKDAHGPEKGRGFVQAFDRDLELEESMRLGRDGERAGSWHRGINCNAVETCQARPGGKSLRSILGRGWSTRISKTFGGLEKCF
jgi:hypothetical protein